MKRASTIWQMLPSFVTISGGVLVSFAAYDIVTQKSVGLLALFALLLGRLCDILDGFLARKIGVVSKIGAFLDVFVDKVTIFVCLYAFIVTDVVPLWVWLPIVVQNSVNLILYA